MTKKKKDLWSSLREHNKGKSNLFKYVNNLLFPYRRILFEKTRTKELNFTVLNRSKEIVRTPYQSDLHHSFHIGLIVRNYDFFEGKILSRRCSKNRVKHK